MMSTTVEPEIDGLKEQCRRSGGHLVLRDLGDLMAILQKGGRHALQNSRQGDGKFKNQVVLSNDGGLRYYFDYYSDEPLSA